MPRAPGAIDPALHLLLKKARLEGRRRDAAVDDQFRPRDEPGIVRGQVQASQRDIPWLAELRERSGLEADPAVQRMRMDLLGHFRVDEAWIDPVHAYLVGRTVNRGCFGQGPGRALGGVIARV